MASTIRKVEKIRQIVKLKHIMKRWKATSLRRGSNTDSDSDSSPARRIPAGFLAVYVGSEKRRFVIPTRYLNLPIFVSLLKKAEEEFGFHSQGGLVLPCEVGFFKGVLKILERDEHRFRGLKMEEMLNLFTDVSLDSCKEESSSRHGFTPLLKKAKI
ncbi:auxin-induced protein 6B-like [Tasmannia lanceolata]|uniref:auxin-induced protein 6B-like n=1 Tax=Tasmannia lanceolata TaxID=3420 RepID=UPI0040643E8C